MLDVGSAKASNAPSASKTSPTTSEESVLQPQKNLRPLFLTTDKHRNFSNNIRTSVQVATITEESNTPQRGVARVQPEDSVIIHDEEMEDMDDLEQRYFQQRAALVSLGREVDAELAASRAKFPDSGQDDTLYSGKCCLKGSGLLSEDIFLCGRLTTTQLASGHRAIHHGL